jgi:RND family efflux transporter MFP subunit
VTRENEGRSNFSSDSTGSTTTAHPGPPRRKIILLIGILCVLALIGIGLIPRLFLNRDLNKEASEQATTAANVFVTVAQASPASVSVQLSGTMSPITEAPVLARADGYLEKRLVDIGDHVRNGQVLAVITAPDLDQQVQQAGSLYQESKSTLEQSKAALEQAKSNAGIAGITAERWAALVKRGAVSRQANDNYQFAYSSQIAAVGVATASVAAANNSVGANAANLNHFRELQSFEVVRAPFDGVITQRNVDSGALVTATNTLLFRVARNDVLRTFIDVPQINAPSIKIGDTADLTFVQHPGTVFHGTVTRTSEFLNLNTRTLLTEVDIDNKEGLLLPGMYATVTFDLPRTVSAILIPSEALVFRSNGTTVAVVDDRHVVTFRKVVVGHDYGATVEIVSGLKAGEAVVVNPNDTTVEGAKVNPVSVKQAAGSLSSASPSVPAGTSPQTNTQQK